MLVLSLFRQSVFSPRSEDPLMMKRREVVETCISFAGGVILAEGVIQVGEKMRGVKKEEQLKRLYDLVDGKEEDLTIPDP